MRYIHISARLTTIMGPNNTPQTVVVRPGKTMNVGRNAEKRMAKTKAARTEMLADRRLRQRQFEGSARVTSKAA